MWILFFFGVCIFINYLSVYFSIIYLSVVYSYRGKICIYLSKGNMRREDCFAGKLVEEISFNGI